MDSFGRRSNLTIHSYNFQIKTVAKPCHVSLHASVVFAWRKPFKEMVGWMSCISHNVLRFAHTPSVIDRFNGWQRKPDYFRCALHKCFQLGFLLVGGTAKPHSDGESQDIFDHGIVKTFEDNLWDANFFNCLNKYIILLRLFNHWRNVIAPT